MGYVGVDVRAATRTADQEPGFHGNWKQGGKSLIQTFMKLIPFQFIIDVVIKCTSDALIAQNIAPLTEGEFLRYLGLWLLISTCSGFAHKDFWDIHPHDEKTNPCPYRLGSLMSKKRFDAITRELRFTDCNKPTFLDRIWEVRQMIDEWNDNMKKIFVPSWIMCLDESLLIWFSMFTCPGWVFCPRKLHPVGNEYHSMCCGLSGVMVAIELVEGKDRPRELGQPEYKNLGGKTIGLLLRLLKNYFGSARYVVLDSGFCVLKALVELKRRGVFACALIKKRRFWPAGVPGDVFDRHFSKRDVGETDAILGVLDGVKYFLCEMKEPDYIMKMMATGGALFTDGCREVVRHWTVRGNAMRRVFTYTKPFHLHFKFRHVVDDHNKLRHALPSIEDSWRTNRWPVRVFLFILAITEVNTFLVMCWFNWEKEDVPTYLSFRRKLAWELIENKFLLGEKETTAYNLRRRQSEHKLETAPRHASIFNGRRWKCSANLPYQQYKCKGTSGKKCKKRIRTYCSCDIGAWMCRDCHVLHFAGCRDIMMMSN